MKKTNIICSIAAAVFLATGCGKSYTPIDNGAQITINSTKQGDAKTIRVVSVTDKIFRVTASPENEIAETQSLCVNYKPGKVNVEISESDGVVTLATSQAKAQINVSTGEVKFLDQNGNAILREQEGGGKTFNPVEVEGTKGYSFKQVWESDDNEAFFGLGQHQADEWNYKGKNEELFQYNTKVSLPVVISNKNYAILWDNYSLSRFGDSREYMQLDKAFKVYDKTGKEGGLSSTWIAQDQKIAPIQRIEPYLYFENIKANKELLPKGFPLMGSNVTFEGSLEPKETGEYKFIIYYAGYTKVFINGENVMPENPEIWRTAWNPNARKFSVKLEAGKKADLRIEWIPDGGESYCGLRVLTPVDPKEQNRLSLYSEMGDNEDYYFIKGDNIDQVISGYRTLTGKSQVMPKWALGFWQSRERYKTQKEMLDNLNEFRKQHIPIDNIVLDWNYWPETAWGSHEFDTARFQNPKQLVDSIHALNARMMISVWPKFYCTTEHYKEFDQKGWMYKQAVIDSIKDWVGPGYVGSFYDAYSPEARKLFWNQMNDHLFLLGIDAWWMDASEPNVRDCTDMEYRKKLCGPTALGPSTKYFNAYALVNAMAIYDGQRSVANNQRVFLLTRSGFPGLQRYSTATWSGDIGTRWEDMKAQISAGLNFSIAGIPYWTMDIGGFSVESRYSKAQLEYDKTGKVNDDLKEWRELQTRWYQFGTFCPLFRAHGQFPLREVYNIAPQSDPAYQSIVWYNKLRYRMMPYIYSMSGMVNINDYTIMRALVMDFAGDNKALNISDQFMFGPALMVCPVYKYQARTKEVYLPACEGWYDFYTGDFLRGAQSINASAPYDRLPLYVKAGSIIPFGKEIEYTAQDNGDELTIAVYTGADASFTIYEDEGTNYNYEKGDFVTIDLKYTESTGTLVIGDAKGDFKGYVKNKKINIICFDKSKAKAFDLNKVDKSLDYKGTSLSIKIK